MYIAMNRFTVRTANAQAFEDLWLGRESRLPGLDGFVEFHMLKGPVEDDDTVLYASHTVWRDVDAFKAWTKSMAFRDAHKGARQTAKLHEGSPTFEGFETIQHIAAPVS
ncbi:antibiotic biosynthesis monooxygenase [Rhodobacteraceae bacterium M385]|nr:antibiotic biosynthesis monooxygenase [Rhodobacteraceae bacterium M385]